MVVVHREQVLWILLYLKFGCGNAAWNWRQITTIDWLTEASAERGSNGTIDFTKPPPSFLTWNGAIRLKGINVFTWQIQQNCGPLKVGEEVGGLPAIGRSDRAGPSINGPALSVTVYPAQGRVTEWVSLFTPGGVLLVLHKVNKEDKKINLNNHTHFHH